MRYLTFVFAILVLPAFAAVERSVAPIPAQFIGEWNSHRPDCGTDENDSMLVIGPNHLTYWESDGPVESVVVKSQSEIELTAKLSGEDETWIAEQHLRLSPDGDELTWVNPSGPDFVRHRCPKRTSN